MTVCGREEKFKFQTLKINTHFNELDKCSVETEGEADSFGRANCVVIIISTNISQSQYV